MSRKLLSVYIVAIIVYSLMIVLAKDTWAAVVVASIVVIIFAIKGWLG